MFTVYVIYSPSSHQRYIGYTSDLPNRFLSHNKLATKGHTIKYRPWLIAHTEEFENKTEAIKQEKQLKLGAGRVFIGEIINKKFGGSNDIRVYQKAPPWQ